MLLFNSPLQPAHTQVPTRLFDLLEEEVCGRGMEREEGGVYIVCSKPWELLLSRTKHTHVVA
jgi:hypothetical protein